MAGLLGPGGAGGNRLRPPSPDRAIAAGFYLALRLPEAGLLPDGGAVAEAKAISRMSFPRRDGPPRPTAGGLHTKTPRSQLDNEQYGNRHGRG